MRRLISFCHFLISANLLAQEVLPDKLVSPFLDVLTNKNVQTNKEIGQATSKLEDINNQNMCSDPSLDLEKCQSYANSLMPSKYKEKGWKTLFEIKYRPIEEEQKRDISKANFAPIEINQYRISTGNPEQELKTKGDLEAEVTRISDWYKYTGRPNPPSDSEIKGQLIVDQFSNNKYYENLPDLASKNNYMFDRLKEYSKAMTDDEYLTLITKYTDLVGYNDNRAAFIQQEGAAKGIVTPFEQIMGTNLGICGDINSISAKMGEIRGWETFTIGYATLNVQHVLTALHNPKDPNKLMIANYSNVETQDLRDGDWIRPTSTESPFADLGMQLRIFKNDKTQDPMGKMQQIATIPTALGSFMHDLFQKENQISKAMPQNENYRQEKMDVEHSSRNVKLKNSNNKIMDRNLSEGVVVYEGEIDNAKIYGVGVSFDVYKDIYRWDSTQNKCVLKKSKYFSTGVAGSLINLPIAQLNDLFYVYLNMKGGEIFHLYQSENFQFKGLIGYELEGIAANSKEDGFVTGDGNFTALMGVMADYEKKGIKIHTGLTYETTVGLKNQNLFTDFSSIPSNVSFMNFNAISLDADISKKLSSSTSLVSANRFSLTRVGGRVVLSTGIIHDNTSIMVSYQGRMKSIPIGNGLKSVNLLQNFNNTDGFRVTVGQQFSNKKGNFSGSISGYGGMSTTTPNTKFIGGASLKINLGGQKRKPSSTR